MLSLACWNHVTGSVWREFYLCSYTYESRNSNRYFVSIDDKASLDIRYRAVYISQLPIHLLTVIVWYEIGIVCWHACKWSEYSKLPVQPECNILQPCSALCCGLLLLLLSSPRVLHVPRSYNTRGVVFEQGEQLSRGPVHIAQIRLAVCGSNEQPGLW